ncbi:MAG: OmpA family protein [Deltaproteobacteria bacterium]|nr:OmpA family protein [Deltaproteobacteria bacterium]
MAKTVLVAVVAAVFVTGCGVEKEIFEAKVSELAKMQTTAAEEREACNKKIGDLEKGLGDCRKEKEIQAQRISNIEDSLTQKQQQINTLGAENSELKEAKEKLSETKKKLEEKTESYENLTKSLKAEIDAGKVELTNLKGKLTVKMKDKILFSSGSTKIAEEGKEALKKLAEALKSYPDKAILVEGHTDNVPLGAKSAYPDNWDLSVARALAVVKLLQEEGIDPTRLGAAGRSQYQPIATNDTVEGKSANRRIDIVLVALDQAAPAPVAKPAEEKKEEKKDEKKKDEKKEKKGKK